ncbi:phage tail protein [Enterobacter cancerogenus]
MTVKYKTVITKAGAEKLAAATVPNGKKVNFTAMAVGDGGGTLPTPDPNQTKLVNEVWRHALNKISQDNKQKNYVVAEMLIPPETGGFWMRELGLYDDTGTLIAVGNMAESYKPALAEGSGRAQTVRMVIMVSDIESVELTIDTSMVMATQDYVDDRLAEHEQSRRHPDATLTEKGFTQLNSATDSVSESVAATPKAVKAAYDLAKGKYTAQDASTSQKGIVQLSSAIDSTSESVAATPKAVKAAYDLAKGKYTAQDATTAQKGIVQLSSATDSSSESAAATPKAVKAVNDELNTVKNTLGTVASKDVQTSKDDITAGRVLVNGSAIAVRSVKALAGATGNNVADANNLPTNSVSFVYSTAGNSPGITGSLMDFCGLNGSYNVQIAAAYNGGGNNIKFRTFNGDAEKKWNPWYTIYHSGNKPSAGDVGALPITGGTLKGALAVVQNGPGVTLQNSASGQAAYVIGKDYNGDNSWYVGRGGSSFNISFYNYKGANGININEDGSIALNPLKGKSATVNGSLQVGAVGSGILNIGDNDSGLRSSKDGQVDLYANSHLMGYWNTTTFSFTGQIIPTNYTNFDNRYYTKTQSDARYGVMNGFRRGGQQLRNPTDAFFGNWESPAGCVVTGITMENRSDGRKLGVYYRQLQYLNKQTGSWVNVGD